MFNVNELSGKVHRLGRTEENNFKARKLDIDCTTWMTEYPGATLSLNFVNPNSVSYPAAITVAENILTWQPVRGDVSVPGQGYAEVMLVKEDGDIVGLSDPLTIIVEKSASPGPTPESPEPSWLVTVVQKATETLTKADEALQSALAAAEAEAGAQQHMETATDQAEAAAGSATLASQDKETTAGYLTTVLESMGIVQQAMTDLLNMMGNQLATLVNGKLSPDQIPPLSLIKTETVATRADMLALTIEDVQQGDGVKVITDVDGYTHLYQLRNDDDISNFDSWTPLNTPDMFVSEAGHALTADNALDSEKVTGHRLAWFETYDAMIAGAKVSGVTYFGPIAEV